METIPLYPFIGFWMLFSNSDGSRFITRLHNLQVNRSMHLSSGIPTSTAEACFKKVFAGPHHMN